MDNCSQNYYSVYGLGSCDLLPKPFKISESEFFINDGFDYEVIYGPILRGQIHLIKGSNQFYLVKFSEENKLSFQYESYRIIRTNNPILNNFGFSSMEVLDDRIMQNDRIVSRGLKDMYDIVPHNVKGF